MKYVEVTGDQEFLREYGAEMLVETARLWYDLGFFSDRLGGKFCIHGVTGPDEYTTVVNNNTYTNLMARENLWYAADVVERCARSSPDHYRALVHRTRTRPRRGRRLAAGRRQHVRPVRRAPRSTRRTTASSTGRCGTSRTRPKDKFPLLLHYHPLVIYRYQVIKQADIVLAMFLLGNEFTPEQKKRNFDYYDPLTTGDSSLSACIQSIVAAEIGYDERGLELPALRRADGPRRRRRQRPRRRPHRQHRRHLDGHRLRPGRHARLRRDSSRSTRTSRCGTCASPSPSAASASPSTSSPTA